MPNHLPIIILNGRPAAGKSEVIDFLKGLDPAEREAKFHIGPFEEIDDFPYVWETFEIDDIYKKHGQPLRFNDERGYFQNAFVWTYLIERINLDFKKRVDDAVATGGGYPGQQTAIVEFARGTEHGGFRKAYETLSDQILEQAVILYIKVSHEESMRKNRRRFKPELADSSLFHSVPDHKMDFYYRDSDWAEIEAADPGVVDVRGFKVPYAVLDNEPEVTDDHGKMGPMLEGLLADLWARHQAK